MPTASWLDKYAGIIADPSTFYHVESGAPQLDRLQKNRATISDRSVLGNGSQRQQRQSPMILGFDTSRPSANRAALTLPSDYETEFALGVIEIDIDGEMQGRSEPDERD
jgi:hypothetical protein